MRKLLVMIFGVVVACMLLVGMFIASFVYGGIRSSSQKRALQNRTDYGEIALAAVALTHAITNDSKLLRPNDAAVPPALRALSPKYISASSNQVLMEFHGGFDHYGFIVRQSTANSRQWTISYYTERKERLLTTVSED
jgi:hypothetical protein